jgi:hypothetical protein
MLQTEGIIDKNIYVYIEFLDFLDTLHSRNTKLQELPQDHIHNPTKVRLGKVEERGKKDAGAAGSLACKGGV